MLRQLIDRYEQYAREAAAAREKAGLCDGLFGFGRDPRKDPCHEAFYQAAGEWVTAFLQTEPGASQCAEAVHWLLTAADIHREEDTFWHLYAAQGHALPLIPRMTGSDCKALLQWYDKAYPARDRMPVQDNVVKALKKGIRKP